MEQHSGGPVVTIEGLPDGGGLLLGGGDHDKPQTAFGCKSPEVTYALAFCQIGDALAGQVVCGAAEIDANQLQDTGLFVFAVRCICQGRFEPRTLRKDFRRGLPFTRTFAERGIHQNRIFHGKGLWPEWSGAIGTHRCAKQIHSRLVQNKILDGVKERVFLEVAGAA